jgi:hypothetical protein
MPGKDSSQESRYRKTRIGQLRRCIPDRKHRIEQSEHDCKHSKSGDINAGDENARAGQRGKDRRDRTAVA